MKAKTTKKKSVKKATRLRGRFQFDNHTMSFPAQSFDELYVDHVHVERMSGNELCVVLGHGETAHTFYVSHAGKVTICDVPNELYLRQTPLPKITKYGKGTRICGLR